MLRGYPLPKGAVVSSVPTEPKKGSIPLPPLISYAPPVCRA